MPSSPRQCSILSLSRSLQDHLTCLVALPIAWTAFGVLFVPAIAQHRFETGDVITFADARDIRGVDVTTREVVMATAAGIWRLDRFTLQPLDPWFTGLGSSQAVPLGGGIAILYQRETATLWLATKSGLLAKPFGLEQWKRIGPPPGGGITSLGERNDTLFVESGGDVYGVSPFGYRFLGRMSVGLDGIRWTGERASGRHTFPFYSLHDYSFRFEPSDGRLVDRDFTEFRPTFDLLDRDWRRRYICYPGLGIAVADERTWTLELIQTGPAGGDIRAIALGRNGEIWVGGDNTGERQGLSRFERQTGRWERFGRKLVWGLESQRASDLLWNDGRLYAATDEGLVVGDVTGGHWRTLRRMDGLPGTPLRALGLADGWLVVGSDEGVNRMLLPTGPFFRLSNPRLKDLRAAQVAADGDTIWVAGLQGLYRGTPEGRWESVGGDETIGDEPARCVAVSSDFVYVGGENGVRQQSRASGRWTAIRANVHLGGGQTLALAATAELLWIGTTVGLFRYDGRRGRFLRFGTAEGLPHNRIQRLVLEADTLWIGTPKGLTRFLWNRPLRDND